MGFIVFVVSIVFVADNNIAVVDLILIGSHVLIVKFNIINYMLLIKLTTLRIIYICVCVCIFSNRYNNSLSYF